MWDTALGKPRLKEGTLPRHMVGWGCQFRQTAEPGRDKESYSMAREGFSDAGVAAIAKVHIKVKVIETNGEHKSR